MKKKLVKKLYTISMSTKELYLSNAVSFCCNEFGENPKTLKNDPDMEAVINRILAEFRSAHPDCSTMRVRDFSRAILADAEYSLVADKLRTCTFGFFLV